MSCLPEAIFDLLGAGQQKGKRPASYTHLLSADVDLCSIILVSIYGDLIDRICERLEDASTNAGSKQADSLPLGCRCAAVRPGYGKILFSKARGYRLSKIYHSYQAQRML